MTEIPSNMGLKGPKHPLGGDSTDQMAISRMPHQDRLLRRNPDRCALLWDTGSGKTRAAVEWAALDGRPAIVICPKPLKANWAREISKWADPADFTVVSKEEFRRDARTLPAFAQVVVDECHVGFNTPMFGSQSSKALKWYLSSRAVPRVLLLTATPYSSSPWNVFNMLTYLGQAPGWREWRLRYFVDVRMGPRIVPQPRRSAPSEIAALIRRGTDVFDVVRISDVIASVPEQAHAAPEEVAMTRTQRALLAEAYDPVPIVRYTRLHEVENGFLKVDDGERAEIRQADCAKDARIAELCLESPKVAVVCRYNAQIDRLARALRGFAPQVVRGGTPDRDAVVRAANAAESAVLIIQADCAEGYSLSSFPLCVFASMSYSYVKWRQMCGRFLRLDDPTRTLFAYLVSEGDSIDRAVYGAVMARQDFSIELFAKSIEIK